MKDYSDENSMVCGAEFEESTERTEPSYETERQRSIDEDSLNDTLRDITLSQQIDKLESLLGKEQAE